MFNQCTDNVSGFDLPLNAQQKQVVLERIESLNARYRVEHAKYQIADEQAAQHRYRADGTEHDIAIAVQLQTRATQLDHERRLILVEIDRLKGCLTYHVGIKRPKVRNAN